MRRVALALVVAVAALALPAVASANDRIYWSTTSSIQWGDLSGSGLPGSAMPPSVTMNPNGQAIDPSANKIYWADTAAGKIRSAPLGGGTPTDVFSGESSPKAIALDAGHDWIYWTAGGSIFRGHLNGTGRETLFSGGNPNAIAISLELSQIFWTDDVAGTVSARNIDGSGSVYTLYSAQDHPFGVAIDGATGKLYWANAGTASNGTIQAGSSDGGTSATSLFSTQDAPHGVAVDPTSSRIYWANSGSGYWNGIRYGNLNGTGYATTLFGGAAQFPVLLRAPVGTGLPSVTGGTKVGDELSCSPGSWAPNLVGTFLYRTGSLTYTWLKDGVTIPSATSSTYRPLQAGGLFSCVVTATNMAGSAQQTSLAVPIAGRPTAMITSPAPGGTYTQGQYVSTTFTCSLHAYDPGPLASCNDNNGTNTVSGGSGHLDTSTPGLHNYAVTPTSSNGLEGDPWLIPYTVAGPPTASITSPADDQTYNLGQSVITEFSCSKGHSGPELTSCADSNGDTTSPGTLETSSAGHHTYTVTAIAGDGQTGTAHIHYIVIGPPTASISSPPDNQTFSVGQVVATRFSCTDDPAGPGITSCVDSDAKAPPAGSLKTSTPGARTYNVTATSASGQSATAHIHYTVVAQAPVNKALPKIAGTATVGQRLTATKGTWSGTAPMTHTYQWQRCKPACSNIPNATKSTYTLLAADVGARLRVLVTAHNTAGQRSATSGPTAMVVPTAAQLKALLLKQIVPYGKASKLGALLRKGGYQYDCRAPTTGVMTISWYRNKTLIATGKRTFTKAGAAHMTIKLTTAGKRLLKKTKKTVKLTAKGSFTPTGRQATIVSRAFKLKR